jgi:glycine betaine/proline transport system substrate-binding protein
MHVAVAQGDADLLTNHWDPIHNHLYEKVGGKDTVSKVGVIIEGALQGYLIDKATADKYGITSIDKLKDPEIAKLFDADGDGKADLTGCNPGWGCERVIEHHMDAYELRDTVTHVQGSYFALMADTIARYKQGQPILYFTWTPQWVSGILEPEKDTVWLTVPFTALPKGQEDAKTSLPDGRNLGHPIVKIWTFANKDFVDSNPSARRFLELVEIPIEDINAQNLRMKKGEDKPEDIDKHVKEWINAHQDQFDTWVKEAAAAK